MPMSIIADAATQRAKISTRLQRAKQPRTSAAESARCITAEHAAASGIIVRAECVAGVRAKA